MDGQHSKVIDVLIGISKGLLYYDGGKLAFRPLEGSRNCSLWTLAIPEESEIDIKRRVVPSEMVVTLYKLDASPPVRAVHMVIAAINLPDVEYIDVNLLQQDHLKEDFIKLNPQHTVPTMVDDDFVIWDSHAITTYLITKYADNDSLYPAEPKQRALIDQKMHFDSGILFPALREATAPVVFGSEKGFKLEVLQKIENAYGFTDTFLATRWLAGDEMSVADICCVATISTLNEILAIDGNVFPNLADWMQRCTELDIYKNGNEPGLLMFRQILKNKLA